MPSSPTTHRPPPLGHDPLNGSRLFPTDNPWGIPTLPPAAHAAPDRLVSYRARDRCDSADAIHFFLDDQRFETVWRKPVKTVVALKQRTRLVLTPDFSLYRDMPLVMQQWNTYRNRWCGAWWAHNGLQVIPTVSWSTWHSYDFCFAGIARHSVVAVGTVGVDLHDSAETALFMAGFRELVVRLQPTLVLSYGPLPDLCHSLTNTHVYVTHWETVRHHGRTRRS
ncbi:MAG: DUF4417 domain-containing protein [Anaerolineae bacterium]|nr:DUF4417 domain-containing protein [Anaerolineae bacterium]MCO5193061.1 DUF4417 domain-containing protein [Anaerolineae bacterium]MCO5206187.1 DUF4417 domain-containing protein [Anaerolineae bacterium]